MSHVAPPRTALYVSDPLRAVIGLAGYAATRPLLNRLPVGESQQPVIVLPGLLADDGSTRPMRSVLRRLGYRVYGWRLGRNLGPTPRAVDGLRALHDRVLERCQQPVTVVGWSFGGIFARAMAASDPETVRQVITLGTPFALVDRAGTRASKVYDRYTHLHVPEHQLEAFPPEVRGPLPVPSTSIWSRSDGIVPWQACVETASPTAENIEVPGSHLGLGHNPVAIYAVADRLAQPAGGWQPFRAPGWLRPAYRSRPLTD